MNRSVLAFLLLSWLATSASAQKYEIGAFGGYTKLPDSDLGTISTESKKDDDTKLKARTGFGGRITLNTPGYYGHEIGYWRSKGILTAKFRETINRELVESERQDTIKIHNYFYNFLIYFMPRGEKWRPFMTGGVQMTEFQAPKFDEWTRGRSRHYGANYGVGLKLIPVKNFIMRIDWRHYLLGKPYDLEFADFSTVGGLFPAMEASVGMSIGF